MSDPNDPSEYLKIGDAARLLGVTRRTVYRRVWKGDLPAAKIGGLYFIKRSDLMALLNRGKLAGVEADAPEAELLKCGFCYRLIEEDQVAGPCQAENCTSVLCKTCASEGIRFCARHSPSREQRWQEGQLALEQGKIPLLLKGSAARLREVNFSNRIQQRLERIHSLVHPVSGEMVNIPDWNLCLEAGDERAEVLRLLGRVVLDDVLIAQVPLNSWLHYRLPQPKGKPGLPLEVQIQVVSRLPEVLRDGFDTHPLSEEDLASWLVRTTDEAQHAHLARLVLLASTSGWNADARQVIQGSPDQVAFSHRQVLFYLFDLQSNELIFNAKDELARRYAELFSPLLPAEELDDLIKAIEQELILHQSLTLKQAEEILHQPPTKLSAAFERLAAGGRFSLTDVPGLGKAIIRNY